MSRGRQGVRVLRARGGLGRAPTTGHDFGRVAGFRAGRVALLQGPQRRNLGLPEAEIGTQGGTTPDAPSGAEPAIRSGFACEDLTL